MYHKLKGQAQKTIKQAASDHWHFYCETLNRTSDVSEVWRIAKKMNSVSSQYRISAIDYHRKLVEDNQEISNSFAEDFAKISSVENYSPEFRMYKEQAEKDSLKLTSAVDIHKDELAISLNDEIGLYELRRAIRETKKHSAPGEDNISYGMLQHLSK